MAVRLLGYIDLDRVGPSRHEAMRVRRCGRTAQPLKGPLLGQNDVAATHEFTVPQPDS